MRLIKKIKEACTRNGSGTAVLFCDEAQRYDENSSGPSRGYFSNFGRTFRQGVELGPGQRGDSLDWSLSYSYLHARYDSPACLVSESNSSAETSPACTGESEIAVRRGDRLQGLPAHHLKFNVYGGSSRRGARARNIAPKRGRPRGSENGAHVPDGVVFNGSGHLGGYALLDLATSWKLGPRFELFAEVANVFNRRCSCRPLARRRAIPFCSSSLHSLSPRNAPRRAIIAGMSPARFTQRAFCVLAATGLCACSILPLPRVQPRTEPAPATSVAPKSASPAPAPAATPQAMFERPAAGPVLASFDGQSNKGIDISGGMGEPVFAAAAGQVIYVGSELPGYGNMTIIKYDDTFLTAYGHNGAMLVKEKDKVRRGQKIAEMGSSAADGIKLRFEVRRNGAAVDPVPYLEGKRHD